MFNNINGNIVLRILFDHVEKKYSVIKCSVDSSNNSLYSRKEKRIFMIILR